MKPDTPLPLILRINAAFWPLSQELKRGAQKRGWASHPRRGYIFMSRCNEQKINVNKNNHTPGSPAGIRGVMNNNRVQHPDECNYMYRVQLPKMSGLPPLKYSWYLLVCSNANVTCKCRNLCERSRKERGGFAPPPAAQKTINQGGSALCFCVFSNPANRCLLLESSLLEQH